MNRLSELSIKAYLQHQRAPPMSKSAYTESVEIMPCDAGWQGYENPDFRAIKIKRLKPDNGYDCLNYVEIWANIYYFAMKWLGFYC